MKTTTIQTKNVDVKIKEKAEQVAKSAGFSSLQDVIRIVVIDIAQGELPLKMDWRRRPRDPELREALDDYSAGKYATLDPDKTLSEQILGTT